MAGGAKPPSHRSPKPLEEGTVFTQRARGHAHSKGDKSPGQTRGRAVWGGWLEAKALFISAGSQVWLGPFQPRKFRLMKPRIAGGQ